MSSNPSCIFCKIIKGVSPCHKIAETSNLLAFMDISPLSKGHCLIIPKYHAKYLHELPDDSLDGLLPLAKKIVKNIGCGEYNILQNNGELAHQAVMHVHFHIIPKQSSSVGLGIKWGAYTDPEYDIAQYAAQIASGMK